MVIGRSLPFDELMILHQKRNAKHRGHKINIIIFRDEE